MELKTFLSRVLDSDGFYCVIGLNQDKAVQKFYNSIDQIAETARNLSDNNYNVSFGLATFETADSRKVPNIKSLSSFFLDLDCGEGKEYKDQLEALTALQLFCKNVGLPKPVIVNSGHGVHVYWMLKASVPYDDWYPVALKLRSLCNQHNLLADANVTADGARVLRVPYTNNYKKDDVKQVTFIGNKTPELIDFENFSSLLGGGMSVPSKIDDARISVFEDALMRNAEYRFKNILVKIQKGVGCEQLKYIIDNRQTLSEPMWRAGLSIAKFCEDKEKATNFISMGHDGYDKTLTEEKVNLIKGPFLCTTFDEHNPKICADCPHWGKIKSPIALGKVIKQAPKQDDIPEYPKPYFRGANGGVYIRHIDSDGEPEDKMVYHNDLYVIKRVRDIEIGEAIVMRLHLPKDGIREFTVPLTAVTSKEELRKQLSMQGIAVTRMDELMKYTTTWVNELQSHSEADEARRQFGWTDDDYNGFVVGNQEVRAEEIKFNPPSTPTAGLFPSFEPKGTLEAWKETMNFYNRDNLELHQFVVGTSFGSPLMSFSPIKCACFHIHSKDSGLGKTTAMIAGVSVWGNPDDLILDKEDTYNTKMNRGEIYHNLPLYMDELTNMKSMDLSNLAYQLTGGRQRGRMSASSNIERARGKVWKLLAVTTGNTSMVERISMMKAMPKAEAQRILECRAKRYHFDTKEETDLFSAQLQNNYGHAGKVYIQYVMNNLEETQKLLTQVQARVDEKAGLTAENRFWSALVSCTITGLIIAKRIGLVQYDTNKIFKWAIECLKDNKYHVDDMTISVEETLNDYIHEHWSNVLWIKSTDDLRKQEDGVTPLIIPESIPRGKLVARYETDLKRAFLVPKPLKSWCGEQQINYNAFVQDLITKMGAKRSKARLSKGTHMNLPPTDVIVVDCSIDNENETRYTEN
tara:strand:+ start:83 stop:2833 length:2751 start_codon:yes stop_codon:yes gene_type:complete